MDKALIVGVVEGNDIVTYQDGDTAPLHQTLVYLGDASLISQEEVWLILTIIENISYKWPPIEAKVCGKGVLGKDEDSVVFTESFDMTELQNMLLMMPSIKRIYNRVEQHPTWIPHVSGLSHLRFGDTIRFDALAFWFGNSKYEYPFLNLKSPYANRK